MRFSETDPRYEYGNSTCIAELICDLNKRSLLPYDFQIVTYI